MKITKIKTDAGSFGIPVSVELDAVVERKQESQQPAPKPTSPFGAPFSGPRPGALKRTKRMMQQGSLGSW